MRLLDQLCKPLASRPLNSTCFSTANGVTKRSPGLGHYLERREAFLQSIGQQGGLSRTKQTQSKLLGLLHAIGPSPNHANPTKTAAADDTFGPNHDAHCVRDLVTLRQMMACSMHLGHATSRWNPKMAPFIYGERAGIHIINLERTLVCLRQATNVVKDIASRGGRIVFVGTGAPLQRLTYEVAQDCGQFYVNTRWIGGTITNRRQVLRNDQLVPDLLIVLDPIINEKAVLEACMANIPVMAICDTNVDPTRVTYPIPANDDAFSSVELVARTLSLAAKEGQQTRTRQPPSTSTITQSASTFMESVFASEQ